VQSTNAEASDWPSGSRPTRLSQSRIARFGQGDVLLENRSSNIDMFVIGVSVVELLVLLPVDSGGEIFRMSPSPSTISGVKPQTTDIKSSSVWAKISILSGLEVRWVAPPSVSFGADPRPASGT
jgi:hypothetical protein